MGIEVLRKCIKSVFKKIKKDQRYTRAKLKKQTQSGIYISRFKKELVLTEYAEIINRVLNETKASLRSGNKSMMTPRGRNEAHISTRGKHQEQVADIAREIAKALGLNEDLAELIGKHHDDGHTFNGHTGERIMSDIGQLTNCGNTVHNALSVDMLLSEGILDKIEDAIRVQYPEVRQGEIEKIKEEMYYVFDGILSHNGEGTDTKIKPNFNKTLKDVIDEKNKCYQIRKYDKSIMPMTMEGAIIRFADIIAYTRTDILDGFQMGLLKGFDEKSLMKVSKDEEGDPKKYQDYLRIIGTVVAYRDKLLSENKEQYFPIDAEQDLVTKMKIIKRSIDSKKRQLKSSREGTKEAEEIKAEIERLNELYGIASERYKKCERELIERARKYLETIPEKEKKETVADMMKNVFIKDLKEFSKDKDYIGFSPAISQALFALRDANMKYIVKYTRRSFETLKLPSATLELVERLAQTLVDTGVIHEYGMPERYIQMTECFDRAKREQTIKALLESAETPEDRLKFRRKVFHRCDNFLSPVNYNRTVQELEFCSNPVEKADLERRKVKYKKMQERGGEIISNAISSIQSIASDDLRLVLGEDKYSGEFEAQYNRKLDDIRSIIREICPEYEQDGETYLSISEEMRAEIIKRTVRKRSADFERICAYAFAKEYVEGMSDDTIIDALEVEGIITQDEANMARKRDIEARVADRATVALGESWKNARDDEEHN